MKISLCVILLSMVSSHRLRAKLRHRTEQRDKQSDNLMLQVTADRPSELTIRLSNPDFPFMEMPHRYPFPYDKGSVSSE